MKPADPLIKFLSIWSIGTAIVIIGLITAIITLVLPASQPNHLGQMYYELVAAGRDPGLYRLTIALDVLAWIGWAGLFIGYSSLLRKTAPLRSAFLRVLASGMSIGFLGACLRLAVTPLLADQYSGADSSGQAIILQSYDLLLRFINVTFSAGGLLAGMALLLIASAARYIGYLPRWVAALLGIAGAIHFAKAACELAFSIDLGPLALLANILLIVALFASTRQLRRP